MLEDKIVDTREGVLGAATETGDRTPVMVIKNKTEALDATLALVARGNAVLAEIERLSDNIPLLYRNISITIVNMRVKIIVGFTGLSTCRGDTRSVESQVVFDSSYFKNIDGVEAAIERSSKLQDIDARVKEEHLDTLSKFYKVRFCEFLQLISSIPNLVHLT